MIFKYFAVFTLAEDFYFINFVKPEEKLKYLTNECWVKLSQHSNNSLLHRYEINVALFNKTEL